MGLFNLSTAGALAGRRGHERPVIRAGGVRGGVYQEAQGIRAGGVLVLNWDASRGTWSDWACGGL